MTILDALEEFLFQKRLSGIANNTIHNYRATISLMLRYIGCDVLLESLTYKMVTDYIENVLDSAISPATKSSYIRNDKIFLTWIYDEYELPFDPRKIKVPKSPKKIVHIYNDNEIITLFRECTTSVPWITARNRAIISLMLDSGIRQHEVCRFTKSNIDLERMVFKVTGKGAKDRFVPLGSFTLYLLQEYINLCPFSGTDYVFYDRRGNRLSCNAIRLFVSRLEKKIGFPLSSHKLRHNFATLFCMDNIKNSGQSKVYELSIIMGHESIETTKRYEHFAHEMIAASSSISHLDSCLGNELKEALQSS